MIIDTSSWSQRQTVVLLMLATNPDWRTWAARSALLHREMGNPKVAGNSQAKALTSTTTSGGKRPGATRPRVLLQTHQAFFEKALSPETYHLSTGIQTFRDLIITQTLGCQENHLGSLYLKIR